jgi:putative transposase
MNVELPNRRSIRPKGFDYSEAGSYFVTICTEGNRPLFGHVASGGMAMSEAGAAVRGVWLNLPRRFPTIGLHDFVVMPNHVHGIIRLTRPITARTGAASSAPTDETFPLPRLGQVMRAFKSVSAIEVNRLLEKPLQRVWQRNYYEHIIRSAREFGETQEYIQRNPSRWEQDPENV